MTNQQTPAQRREDYKIQKLIEAIDAKIAIQAKAASEQAKSSRN